MKVLLHQFCLLCWVSRGRRSGGPAGALPVVHSWFVILSPVTSAWDKPKRGVQVLHWCIVITRFEPGRHVIHKFQGIEHKQYKSLLVWRRRGKPRLESQTKHVRLPTATGGAQQCPIPSDVKPASPKTQKRQNNIVHDCEARQTFE